jgi:hypothetical protein
VITEEAGLGTLKAGCSSYHAVAPCFIQNPEAELPSSCAAKLHWLAADTKGSEPREAQGFGQDV